MPQHFLHFTELGNKAGRTVLLCSGWPDKAHEVWAKQVAVLQAKYRLILVDMPGFESDETYAQCQKKLPFFGFSIDAVGEMLRATVDIVMVGRKDTADKGRPPLGIVHDWGAIYSSSAIYNEFLNDPKAAPIFSRVCMIDVGTEFSLTHAFPTMILVCALYQGLAILSFLLTFISGSLGDSLHRWLARTISKAPGADGSRGYWGYPYFRLWFGGRPASSLASYRNALPQHHHADFDRLPVMFAYAQGYRSKVSFHTPRFEEYLNNKKDGSCVWPVPTMDHWFFARANKKTDHIDEFNRKVVEFFEKEE